MQAPYSRAPIGGASSVAFHPPLLDYSLCFLQQVKYFSVQAFPRDHLALRTRLTNELVAGQVIKSTSPVR